MITGSFLNRVVCGLISRRKEAKKDARRGLPFGLLVVWIFFCGGGKGAFAYRPEFSGEAPVSIYHAFDMPYDAIDETTIQQLRQLGFSHIQTSPAQVSAEYGKWHDKYQPLGYKISNRYGDRMKLANLVERAHAYGLKVIAACG